MRKVTLNGQTKYLLDPALETPGSLTEAQWNSIVPNRKNCLNITLSDLPGGLYEIQADTIWLRKDFSHVEQWVNCTYDEEGYCSICDIQVAGESTNYSSKETDGNMLAPPGIWYAAVANNSEF